MAESSKRKIAYVFDVDGTLMPARQKLDEDRANILYQFMMGHDVYIVTGSDYEKTDEQLHGLQNDCHGSYQCSGNELWFKGERVYSNNILISEEMLDWFNYVVHRSDFSIKTGNHVEIRSGLINFSVLGRNANNEQRAKYIKHDSMNCEREHISRLFNQKFGVYDYKSAVAGSTGLDITMLDKDKSQVYRKLSTEYNQIIFFGDHCLEGENDYPFVNAMTDASRPLDKAWHVSSPDHTFELIERISNVTI